MSSYERLSISIPGSESPKIQRRISTFQPKRPSFSNSENDFSKKISEDAFNNSVSAFFINVIKDDYEWYIKNISTFSATCLSYIRQAVYSTENNWYGMTALDIACENANFKIVKHLIEQLGCSPTFINFNGKQCLYYVICSDVDKLITPNNKQIIQYIFNQLENTNILTDELDILNNIFLSNDKDLITLVLGKINFIKSYYINDDILETIFSIADLSIFETAANIFIEQINNENSKLIDIIHNMYKTNLQFVGCVIGKYDFIKTDILLHESNKIVCKKLSEPSQKSPKDIKPKKNIKQKDAKPNDVKQKDVKQKDVKQKDVKSTIRKRLTPNLQYTKPTKHVKSPSASPIQRSVPKDTKSPSISPPSPIQLAAPKSPGLHKRSVTDSIVEFNESMVKSTDSIIKSADNISYITKTVKNKPDTLPKNIILTQTDIPYNIENEPGLMLYLTSECDIEELKDMYVSYELYNQYSIYNTRYQLKCRPINLLLIAISLKAQKYINLILNLCAFSPLKQQDIELICNFLTDLSKKPNADKYNLFDRIVNHSDFIQNNLCGLYSIYHSKQYKSLFDHFNSNNISLCNYCRNLHSEGIESILQNINYNKRYISLGSKYHNIQLVYYKLLSYRNNCKDCNIFDINAISNIKPIGQIKLDNIEKVKKKIYLVRILLCFLNAMLNQVKTAFKDDVIQQMKIITLINFIFHNKYFYPHYICYINKILNISNSLNFIHSYFMAHVRPHQSEIAFKN